MSVSETPLLDSPTDEHTMFTGTVRIKVCEATGLRPTDFTKRHNMSFGKEGEKLIDPYVLIDIDESFMGM